jgi:hypothetical protein
LFSIFFNPLTPHKIRIDCVVLQALWSPPILRLARYQVNRREWGVWGGSMFAILGYQNSSSHNGKGHALLSHVPFCCALLLGDRSWWLDDDERWWQGKRKNCVVWMEIKKLKCRKKTVTNSSQLMVVVIENEESSRVWVSLPPL